jgi:hypothetical protein
MIENIVVIDTEGTAHTVPIFYGNLENLCNENKSNKIQLPQIAVDVDNGILFAWTLYKEDMNQIIEQIFTILTDKKITSVANNFDLPEEHGHLNLYKFQVNFQM